MARRKTTVVDAELSPLGHDLRRLLVLVLGLAALALIGVPASADRIGHSASAPTGHTTQTYPIPLTPQQVEAAERHNVTREATLATGVGTVVMAAGGFVAAQVGRQRGGIAYVAGVVVFAVGAVSVVGANVWRFVWGDPFRDRRFKTVARKPKVHIPPLRGPGGLAALDHATGRYLAAELQLVELGQAFQTSLNRAIGAHDAHDKAWTVRQLAAAARYARLGARLFAGMSARRVEFAQSLAADGVPTTVNLEPMTSAQWRAAVSRGLAALPRALVKLLGSMPRRGRNLRAVLSVASPAQTGSVSLSSMFESSTLDSADRKLAASLRTFAGLITHVRPGALPAGL